MIFTLNFHEFLHTMYKYMLNSVVKISTMFAKYFEHCTIILRGAVWDGHTVFDSCLEARRLKKADFCFKNGKTSCCLSPSGAT